VTADKELLRRVLDNASARRKESRSMRGLKGTVRRKSFPQKRQKWEIRRRIYLIESGKVVAGEYEMVSLAQRERNLLDTTATSR